jgi:hypothetical protein
VDEFALRPRLRTMLMIEKSETKVAVRLQRAHTQLISQVQRLTVPRLCRGWCKRHTPGSNVTTESQDPGFGACLLLRPCQGESLFCELRRHLPAVCL